MFTYDAAGQPLTMTLGEDVYYYVLNVQGDVMGLVDSSGTLMITYYYEGYGECYSLSNTSDKAPLMSANNHLLYRGYVVDRGTGLYYLQSRYYDPNVGRFLNADALVSTGQGLLGNNMFAYCGNNPVMFADISGTARFPCTVNICDGGGGLSTQELEQLNEALEKSGLSSADVGVSESSRTRVSSYEQTVNINRTCRVIMGEESSVTDELVALGIGIGVGVIMDGHPASEIILLAVETSASAILNYAYYTEMPKLPNGVYNVYAIDTVTSRNVYQDWDTGGKEILEYHMVTFIYDMQNSNDNTLRYTVHHRRYYVVEIPIS